MYLTGFHPDMPIVSPPGQFSARNQSKNRKVFTDARTICVSARQRLLSYLKC